MDYWWRLWEPLFYFTFYINFLAFNSSSSRNLNPLQRGSLFSFSTMWDFKSHCTFLSKLKVVYPAVPFLWLLHLKIGFHFPQVPLGAWLSFIFYFHMKSTHTKQLISFSVIYSRLEQILEERRDSSPSSWLCPSPVSSPAHLSPKSGLGPLISSSVFDA